MANSASNQITIKEQQEIAEIINSNIKSAEFDFKFDEVKPSDIRFHNKYDVKNVLVFEEGKNPITQIFDKLSKNRVGDYGRFHHFKSAHIALDIIKNQSIQVSSLFSNDSNDFAEYTEFYKRIGLFHPLVPEDFQKKAFNNNINPKDTRPSDVERNHIFVLCFTQDNHNEKFWKNYANEDHGVAIGFRFSNFNNEGLRLFDFRDVFYDRGYSFDFYNAIEYQLRKYNKMFFSDGVDRFSKFYKRARYNWENETRLCFHYDAPNMVGLNGFLDRTFPIQTDSKSGRKFIDLPLTGNSVENPFFELEIVEVVCGKFVGQGMVDQLKDALKQSFPSADFWQRR
ncbi:hypothetical protein SNE26_07660 [Mucilaginibacter sp. cycad4]|uniref:DUF2971 domain-containing protein n=1 Tax=Mucilaginibacter sp. cycad4 TaxID=3342096 RepID=UPI002AAC4756|nr:DUF2971 domain-containing protein [Mucilaginibacter gossypii]WPV01648.1 hypothetical protein SNE26_07660 [Mucilaginibacter gossypii]